MIDRRCYRLRLYRWLELQTRDEPPRGSTDIAVPRTIVDPEGTVRLHLEGDHGSAGSWRREWHEATSRGPPAPAVAVELDSGSHINAAVSGARSASARLRSYPSISR
jgi:hypothetical protein